MEISTPARISGFVSIHLSGFACLECEQFWAEPLQSQVGSSAFCITYDNPQQQKQPSSCGLGYLFQLCQVLRHGHQSVPSTEKGLYVCGHLAPVQLLTWLQAMNFLLESTLLSTDSHQFLYHSSFMRVPFSCHFLC